MQDIMESAVYRRVLDFIAGYYGSELDEAALHRELSAYQIDSVAFIEMLVRLEDAFHIECEDTMLDMGRYTCIDDIIRYICRRIEEAAGESSQASVESGRR